MYIYVRSFARETETQKDSEMIQQQQKMKTKNVKRKHITQRPSITI